MAFFYGNKNEDAFNDSRYTKKDAAVMVRQMLKVAATCHLHGLVHRDMKPENFLFMSKEDDSPLKLTDFGLSDFIKPGKKFKDVVGSAYYVTPEVLNKKSGPESDVWSIGVITYILLCGKRPFYDRNEDGIFKEVLRNKPDFRRVPWPSISESAKDFIKKLLVTDPRSRLTASQALSHPWVREGGEASEIPLDISVFMNMRQFVKYSCFKQFVLQALEKDLHWKLTEPHVTDILEASSSANTSGFNGRKAFTGAIVEHSHGLQPSNPPEKSSSSDQPSRPVSRFKMMKGNR